MMKGVMSIILLGALSAPLAFSAEKVENKANSPILKPVFALEHIKMIQKQESSADDEVYVTLSVRSKDKPTVYIRTPTKPHHWLSSLLSRVHNVQLWSESLAEGDSVVLILELNEADSMLLNPDDLLGLIQVKLTNTKGQLQAQWGMPNRSIDLTKVVGSEGDIEKFDLKQGNSHYEVYMSVKQ